MTRLSRRTIVGSSLALIAAGAEASAGPLIAAASDLKFALEAIAAQHAERGGGPVRLVFGSSGQLATQIAQGAPFELFLSADEAFVDRLVALGRARDRGQLYALGRIALFASTRSPIVVDAALDGLAAAIDTGQLRRLAIANPDHAPYGRAAEQALRRRGLWDRLQPRLVLGENVSQAAQFAASGGAQAGIIALSLAAAPNLSVQGRFAAIAAEWHDPLRQRMALMLGASSAAVAFYERLADRETREIFQRFGFVMPTQAP